VSFIRPQPSRRTGLPAQAARQHFPIARHAV